MRLLQGTLAEHMRERRKALGLTQEQLADKSGLSPNYIAKLELEKRAPSLNVLIALADALEISVSELLSDEAWLGPIEITEEIARVVHSLDSGDVRFALDTLRLVVGQVNKHLRSSEAPSRKRQQ